MELETGTTLGPYRIDGILGKGGMAVVYRAWEPNLERHVALKVLPAELLHEKTFAERFQREARIAAKLEHPHIVPIHAFGIEEGRPWMALRLLTGGSLADVVELGRLEPARAVAVLRDIADALDYAHQHKVIHRDVKPQNILLDQKGRAYLADFGIGKMLESSSHITATGMIQGTPAYMAPEQAEGKDLGPACDVYALGIVAYQCLAGRVPFSGTPVSVLVKQVSTPPPLPGPNEVAAPLTGALHRCLAKEPTDRWPSAHTFVGALEQGLTQEDATPTLTDAGLVPVTPPPGPPASRRTAAAALGVAALAATALIVLGGLALWWTTRNTTPDTPAVAVTAVEETTALPDAATPPPTAPPAPVAAPRRATAPPPARSDPTPTATPTPVSAAPVAVTAVPAATMSESEATLSPAPEAPEPPPPPPVRPTGPVRVYCEARLEPRLFKKTKEKDVRDSAKDLRGALGDHDSLERVDSRGEADAVILVLERGWKKTLGVPGARQVRIRVTTGEHSIELIGQDKALGFNTWKGAAKGALREAEKWLEATIEATPPR